MLSTSVYFLAGSIRSDAASLFGLSSEMPQPLFLFFWCDSLVLLLRLAGFVDVDEVYPFQVVLSDIKGHIIIHYILTIFNVDKYDFYSLILSVYITPTAWSSSCEQ